MKQQSAQQRRARVLDAALPEFAEFGFHGATTARIAESVGISQSYVMHLFGSKKNLFMESMRTCSERLVEHLKAVPDSDDTLNSLSCAYQLLMREQPDLMKFQLQGWAAAAQDDEVRDACAEQFRVLWFTIADKLDLDRGTAAPLMAALSFFNVVVTLGIQDDQGCAVAGLIQNFQ
ncbi:MAG: TetR/AcrR family transcriptional regulator [Kocuria sp.]|nr:TetR/AcrR family transcriptional regulator [Kocuria sp.]